LIVLHVTPSRNIESIMKYGIKRSVPLLPSFSNLMVKTIKNKYEKDKGLVFTIPESIQRRDKYLKDFTYWKQWGNPRNLYLSKLGVEKMKNEKYYELLDKGPSIFKYIEFKEEIFSIIECKITNEIKS